MPIVGSPDAPKVLVSLFDYTCHHCRVMHGQLKQVHQSFSNQLVIVSLPMPLDGACNPAVKRTPSAHVGACEYTRLGLAVWRAKRAMAEQFDDWIFEPEKPPAVAEVRQFAEKLVGKEALGRALADEWVSRQLQEDVTIYEANCQTAKRGDMPQLIIGQVISFGMIRQVEDLYRLLDQQLALRR